MPTESGPDATQEQSSESRRLRHSLSSIYHDINNPISIVAGNAELLMEMAVSAGLGREFVDPLEDIGKATRQISEHVERLLRLKEQVLD